MRAALVFSVVLQLIAISTAFADTPSAFKMSDAACASIVPSDDEVLKILKQSLQPYVRKTLRQVYFYSYGKQAGLSPQEYFKRVTRGHFGTTHQDSELGNGLYTDSDPLATIHYSNTPAQVMRVGIPAGIGYLDERAHHRSLPTTEENAEKIACYIRSLCKDDNCRTSIDTYSVAYDQQEGKWPDFDPKSFLYSEASQKLLHAAYKDLGIEFIMSGFGLYSFQECKFNPKLEFENEAVFINPDLASRLQLDLFVPNPGSHPSSAYQDYLKYFEAFDFDRDTPGSMFEGPRANVAVDFFMTWYAGMAAAVRQLPSNTDFTQLQKKLSQQQDHSKRNEALTSQLFGCSQDPKYINEAFPPQ